MRFTTILLGGAALVGLGVYLSRKLSAKEDEDESFVYASEKESYGEKIQRASMFAVGAIKTGADKIAEGIKDIRQKDMVKKGAETIDHAKEAAGEITNGIKEKVSKIRKNKDADDAEADFDASAEDTDGATDDFFMAGTPDEQEDDMEM